MVFTSSSRGRELGFLVVVFTPNPLTPSQTHLPRAAEGKQEAITHTGQTAEAHTGPGLGKIYGKCKHLQIACGLGSPNYEDKPTFCMWTGWTGHGSPWVCTPEALRLFFSQSPQWCSSTGQGAVKSEYAEYAAFYLRFFPLPGCVECAQSVLCSGKFWGLYVLGNSWKTSDL